MTYDAFISLIWLDFFLFKGLFYFEDVAGWINMVHALMPGPQAIFCLYLIQNLIFIVWQWRGAPMKSHVKSHLCFSTAVVIVQRSSVWVGWMEEKQIQRRKCSTRENFPLAQTNFGGMIWVTWTLACLSILICLFHPHLFFSFSLFLSLFLFPPLAFCLTAALWVCIYYV